MCLQRSMALLPNLLGFRRGLRHAMKQELSGAVGVERAGEQVTLSEGAAEFAETVELEVAFDTLGDGAQIQAAGHFEDELNGIAAIAIGGESVDQRAIDLEFIERPAAKPAERAEA